MNDTVGTLCIPRPEPTFRLRTASFIPRFTALGHRAGSPEGGSWARHRHPRAAVQVRGRWPRNGYHRVYWARSRGAHAYVPCVVLEFETLGRDRPRDVRFSSELFESLIPRAHHQGGRAPKYVCRSDSCLDRGDVTRGFCRVGIRLGWRRRGVVARDPRRASPDRSLPSSSSSCLSWPRCEPRSSGPTDRWMRRLPVNHDRPRRAGCHPLPSPRQRRAGRPQPAPSAATPDCSSPTARAFPSGRPPLRRRPGRPRRAGRAAAPRRAR